MHQPAEFTAASAQVISHFSASRITHPSTHELKISWKKSLLTVGISTTGINKSWCVEKHNRAGMQLQLSCVQVITWTLVHLGIKTANCMFINKIPVM